MIDINIDFEKYYINQADSNFATIKFKDGKSTIKDSGCGVCCAAMIICKEKDLTSNAGKIDVINEVIKQSTNNDGLLTYQPITYDGTKFVWSTISDMAGELEKNGKPSICQLPGHYVLIKGTDTSKSGYERYLIKDPGKKANTNLAQPMKTYGETIKSKRTLKAQ